MPLHVCKGIKKCFLYPLYSRRTPADKLFAPLLTRKPIAKHFLYPLHNRRMPARLYLVPLLTSKGYKRKQYATLLTSKPLFWVKTALFHQILITCDKLRIFNFCMPRPKSPQGDLFWNFNFVRALEAMPFLA